MKKVADNLQTLVAILALLGSGSTLVWMAALVRADVNAHTAHLAQIDKDQKAQDEKLAELKLLSQHVSDQLDWIRKALNKAGIVP